MEEMKNIQEKAVKDREMQLARKNQEELKQLKKEEKAKKKAKQKQIKALSFNPDEDEDNEEETEEKSERYFCYFYLTHCAESRILLSFEEFFVKSNFFL